MTDPFNIPAAACPGCGAPITFRVGSAGVLVCPSCRAAVARTDRGLERLGQVADLVPTGARLALGLEGVHQGQRFRLLGRLQLRWQQGVWDEWYAAFDDGRSAWLAEAQGRYTLTFRQWRRALPPRAHLAPGREIVLERLGRFVVVDLKQAQVVSATGELPGPFALDGTPIPSADLSGANGAFATIDYARPDEPELFLGEEVPLERLRLTGAPQDGPPAPKVPAAKLSCPRCSGPLELRAPDQARRATCPSCASLLDVSQGALAYLSTLKRPELQLPLGTTARFSGVEYRLIGWLRRRCTIDGGVYHWEEYLLHDERTAGFRWLVCSAGHWSFVEPIGAGDVEAGARSVSWAGRRLRLFSRTSGTVTAVFGELYWEVAVGETVAVRDYVDPPHGISSEASGDEVSWSHAVHLPPEEVAAAFRLEEPLPPPAGVGMMQPNPHGRVLASLLPWAMGAAALAVVIYLVASFTGREVVYTAPVQPVTPAELTAPEAAPGDPSAAGVRPAGTLTDPSAGAEPPASVAVAFSAPFAVRHAGNLRVALEARIDNAWIAVDGHLIRQRDELVQDFTLEASYEHGVDGGEAWTEGSRTAETFLGPVEAGEYVLRTDFTWAKGQPRPELRIEVASRVPRLPHLVVVLCVLLAFPLVVAWRLHGFEKARWEESDVGGDA